MRLQTQVKATPAPSFSPVRSGTLQHKASSSMHHPDGACAERRYLNSQYSSTNHAGLATVPPIVHEVLCSPGQPLDPETRAFMEPRFGHDFSRVQIHDAAPTTIQTKLTIGQPKDKYEQEADRVADQVLARHAHPIVSDAPPHIQRYAVQATGQADTAPASVHRVLASPGRPLGPALQQDMEQRFGHDFSRVRVHSGVAAEQSAREVNANAYTVGPNIVFGAGRFAPGTHVGRRLIAHELTHVVQQSSTVAALSPKLAVGSAGSADERAADAAAARVAHDEAVTVRQPVTVHRTQRLQREETGTYVSDHGDGDYLDAGFNFYKEWKYPNVKRVSTMEDVLKYLDKASGTIDTFRIVSHGSSSGLLLGLLPDVSPSFFDATAAEFTTEQRFREQFTDLRLLSDQFFEEVVEVLLDDQETRKLLNDLGVGATTPDINDSIGILLRAILETEYLANVQLDTGGAPVIANRGELDKFNSARVTSYTPPNVDSKTIEKLSSELSRVMSDVKIVFPAITQEDADTLADPFIDPDTKKRSLWGELLKSIEEGAGGPYLKLLRSVRDKIDENTHVEIRGCNIGNTQTFLDELRGFFGNANALPSISAPDLYQYFFQLNFQTFDLSNPDEVDRLEAEFDDPATGLAQGLEDTRRILGGEMTRVVNDTTLYGLSKRYGYDETRLKNLNPEIDPDNLITGQVIWLVQRTKVQAGRYQDLGDFCRDYLGNQYAWPAVWSANVHIENASQLRQNDHITLPKDLLTLPVATPDPTFADLETRLSEGGAVVGIHTGDNKPFLTLQHEGRASALSGWLAAQQFDPNGRAAAVLSQLYAGKKFAKRADKTYIQFLSHAYPCIEDPIFPEDPRYKGHIIRRP